MPETIKELIDKKGLKHKYVAQKLGYSPQWLSEKLKKEKSFTVEDANKLAVLLGESREYITSIILK